MVEGARMASFRRAAPFWLSLLLVPVVGFAAQRGGWSVALISAVAWWLFAALDALTGMEEENADPETGLADLFWYRLITLLWFPVQATLIYGTIFHVTRSDHLSTGATLGLFFGIGVVSGSIGIVYAHELLHQRNRIERWLGDLLLAMALYSHFRTEHLLVHHRHVGTPADAVTAR